MRSFIGTIYISILRVQGLAGLALSVLFFANLPGELARGHHMLIPSFVVGTAAIASVAFVVPRLTPNWLGRPSGWAGAFAVLIHTLAPIFFMFLTMAAIIPLEGTTEESVATTKAAATSLSALMIFASAVLWLLALVLCFVAPKERRTPVADAAAVFADDPEPVAPAPSPPARVTPEDLRALRQSRMAKI